MGSSQSTQSIKNSVTDIINKNMFNSFTKKVNETNVNCTGSQNINITTAPTFENINCGLVAGQNMNISCRAESFFRSQDEQKLKTDIQNSLDQSLESNQKNQNPSFTLVPYSDQSSKDLMNIKNYIKNIVEKNLTSVNLNKCIQITKGIQNMNLTLDGKYVCSGDKKLEFNQDLAISQYSKCASDIVTKTLNEDEFINKLATKAVSSQSNITSSIGAIVALIVILLIIGLFAFFAFKKSPAGIASSAGSQNITPDLITALAALKK